MAGEELCVIIVCKWQGGGETVRSWDVSGAPLAAPEAGNAAAVGAHLELLEVLLAILLDLLH